MWIFRQVYVTHYSKMKRFAKEFVLIEEDAENIVQEQNIYALADVSDLFEKYFSTFVKDNGDFSNNFNIKCLGIVSFFNAIPYKDKGIIEPILQNFDVDYSSFIDAIEKLDRLELVEIRYDFIKIPAYFLKKRLVFCRM